MRIKFNSEKVYLLALTLAFWETTFFATLSWTSSMTPIVYPIAALCRKIVIILLFLVLCMRMFNSKMNLVYYIISVIIMVGLYQSYQITNEHLLLYTGAFMLFAKDMRLEKILEVYRRNINICIISIIVMAMLGLANNKEVVFDYGIGYSLGTGHPNNIAALLVNYVLLTAYLKYNFNLKKICIISFCLAIVVWTITASRTATTILIIFSFLSICYHTMQIVKVEWMIKSFKVLILVLVVGSIYLMSRSGSISNIFDANFGVRFTQASNLLNDYGIHFFGSDIQFVSTLEAISTGARVVVLDNAYLRLFIYNGIFCFMVFILSIIYLVRKSSMEKDYFLLIIVSMFLLSGLMEKTVYMLQYNFTLLTVMAVKENSNCARRMENT